MSTTSAVSAALVKDGTPSSPRPPRSGPPGGAHRAGVGGPYRPRGLRHRRLQAFTTWGIVDPFFFGSCWASPSGGRPLPARHRVRVLLREHLDNDPGGARRLLPPRGRRRRDLRRRHSARAGSSPMRSAPTSRWSTRSRVSSSARSSSSRSASVCCRRSCSPRYWCSSSSSTPSRAYVRSTATSSPTPRCWRLAGADHPARHRALRSHLDHRQPAQRLRLRHRRRAGRRGARRAERARPGHQDRAVPVRSQRRVRDDARHLGHRARRRVADQQAGAPAAVVAPACAHRGELPLRLRTLPSFISEPSARQCGQPCPDDPSPSPRLCSPFSPSARSVPVPATHPPRAAVRAPRRPSSSWPAASTSRSTCRHQFAPAARLLQEVRRQRPAEHRAGRRCRRRGSHGLGQVDMAGAWYNHTIEFQAKGKAVEDVVQLSVAAPGERDVRQEVGRHLGRRPERQDPRRHRPGFRHRHPHPVPGRQEGHQDQPVPPDRGRRGIHGHRRAAGASTAS